MKRQSFSDYLEAALDKDKEDQPEVAMPHFHEAINFFFIDIPKKEFRSRPNRYGSVVWNKIRKNRTISFTTPISVKVQEPKVFKNKLKVDEVLVWELFEQEMNCQLGSATSKTEVLKAYRSFAKKNHPDTAEQKTQVNFAEISKIKNDLLKVLESYL